MDDFQKVIKISITMRIFGIGSGASAKHLQGGYLEDVYTFPPNFSLVDFKSKLCRC